MSHSMMVILGGLALLAFFILTGKKEERAKNALLFIPLWFVLSLINLLIGVFWADYSFGLEAKVFLMVFGAPAVAAFILSRMLR